MATTVFFFFFFYRQVLNRIELRFRFNEYSWKEGINKDIHNLVWPEKEGAVRQTEKYSSDKECSRLFACFNVCVETMDI